MLNTSTATLPERPLKRDRTVLKFIGIVVLAVVAFCGLLAIMWLHRNDPPGTWGKPPIYPGAQNVAVDQSNIMGKRLDFYLVVEQVTTFQTGDSPSQVLAFYKDALRGGDWDEEQPSARGEAIKPDLTFLAFGAGPVAPPMYTLDVIVTTSAEGLTDVEVDSSYFPGY